MKKKELRIVALPYYEVGASLDGFMSEAPGRAMTLRPEPTNVVDAHAIRAYDWQGRHVGYVAHHSQQLAWLLLRGSGRHSLRGTVTDVDKVHKCVIFECSVETVGEVQELYPPGPFLDWTYTGPVLKPTPERSKLEYMTEELCERLDERASWNDRQQEDFAVLMEQFCQLSQYDLSAEMADYRRRLFLRLKGTGHSELSRLADELQMSVGRMGRSLNGGDVHHYWMNILTATDNASGLMPSCKGYDAEEVRAQLEEFPEGLYDVWLLNRGQFIQRVLYMHIPYDVLWKLVSGIAFVEAAERRDDVGTTVDEQEEPSTSRLHLPKALATPRAKEYWQRLQEAGFVDDRCRLMPETSRRQAMYIAEVFAEKAGIRSKWSTFQQLWGLKNLAQEKWSFLQTAQLPLRSKEIDALFEK